MRNFLILSMTLNLIENLCIKAKSKKILKKAN